jgi:hypothetical protein
VARKPEGNKLLGINIKTKCLDNIKMELSGRVKDGIGWTDMDNEREP